MTTDENRDEMNQEPIEDGLSALRRLAALDKAGPSVSQHGSPSDVDEMVEIMPDWLELLLAKYGEEASMLAGVKGRHPGGAPVADSEVAILLDQMAAGVEGEPASDKLATSVDWGEAAQSKEEEQEEETADWFDRTAQSVTPPPEIPPDQETPDWLSEISTSSLGVEIGAEPETLAEEEEVPDWLQELSTSPAPSSAPQAEEPGTAPSEEEVPDWLRELDTAAAQSEETSRVEPTPEPPSDMLEAQEDSGAIPDWLARLTAAAPEVETHKPPSPAEETELGEPTWPEDVEPRVPVSEEGGAVQEPVPEAEEETPDWLLDLEAAAEAPGDLGEEIPDWLREMEGVEGLTSSEAPAPSLEMPEQAPEEPEEEIPDWLRELEAAEEKPAPEPVTSEAPPSPPAAEILGEALEEPEEEMPDWLRQLEAAQETPGLPATQPSTETGPELPAEEGEPEVPEWLASLHKEESFSLDMAEQEVPPDEYQPGEVAEEPEWLAELRSTGKQDPWRMEQQVVDAEEEAFPDWLAELRASQTAAEKPSPELEFLEEIPESAEEEAEFALVEQPPVEPEAEIFEIEQPEALPLEEEYPVTEETGALDWLAEIEAAAELEEITEEEAATEEIPAWPGKVPTAELPEEAEIPESEKATVETVRLPEWLTLSEEEESEVSPPAEEGRELEEAVPPAEVLAPAEVPDWLLQLKPEEVGPGEVRIEEAAASEDVLEGIPGLLPVAEEELEAEEEPIATLRSRFGVPQVADVEGAKLFGEIAAGAPQEVAEKEKAKAEPETRRKRVVANLVWALVFILLVLAIAVSLMAVLNRVGDLLGGPQFGDFFGSPRVIDPGPVNTFRAQLTRLPADSVVIVSFDYDPATEAEMGPLADIIVSDLLDHQAKVVGVSLRPQGAAMAQAMFDQFDDEYPYAQRTINLGYLPGQTTGVRNLAFLSSAPLFQSGAETLQDLPAWQDVGGLSDVALVVVLADSPLPVRWWVEQLGPGTRSNRPMIAAVSKAADPSVRPYYNQIDPKSGQLLGLLSGISDAAAYENWLDQPGRAVQSLAAQSVAHLGVVILSLGGTVVGFRTQATRERE
jgi:hypothetical protein